MSAVKLRWSRMSRHAGPIARALLTCVFLIGGTLTLPGCNAAKNLDKGAQKKAEDKVLTSEAEHNFHIKEFREDLKKRWEANPLGARKFYEGKTVIVRGTLGPKSESGESYELRGAGARFAYLTPHAAKGDSLRATAPGSEIEAKCVIAVIDTSADSSSVPKDIGFGGCISTKAGSPSAGSSGKPGAKSGKKSGS